MIRFLFDRDTWQEIFDSLSKNKLRSVLTMVGVWWGILLLISLLGSAKGVENSFNRFFGDSATNSVEIWGSSTSIPFKGFQEGKRVRLTLSAAEKIKENIEGVDLVLPSSSTQNKVFRNSRSGNFSISGDYPLLLTVKKMDFIQGRFINQNDMNLKRKVAIISDRVYKQLFKKGENPVGKPITINKVNFTVIGLLKRGYSIHIPFTTFQQIHNRGNSINSMNVTGGPEYDIVQIEENVKLLLNNLNGVHPHDKRAFGSRNSGKEYNEVKGFLIGMQFLTWFVGLSTLIAGVFAIGNILLITVKERTKEIGVRRALGATPYEIKRQIVVEAVFLTLVAGIFGIISGGWILIAIDHFFGHERYSMIVNASVPIEVVLAALLILVTLGTLIGLIPAFKATRIKPIEALREE